MKERVVFAYEEGTVWAKLKCEIDHHTARQIREKIDKEIFVHRPTMIYLDFSEVRFMDSSGIGLVMGRYKLMKTVQGRIRVENLSPGAYNVMVLAGLEKLGEIKQKEVV